MMADVFASILASPSGAKASIQRAFFATVALTTSSPLLAPLHVTEMSHHPQVGMETTHGTIGNARVALPALSALAANP